MRALSEAISDQEIYEIARLLVTPVTVRFLYTELGVSRSTMYRWLGKRFKPVLERHRGLYWLCGYAGAHPSQNANIPKDSRWLRTYQRLGWVLEKETTDEYVLSRGSASSDPKKDIVPADFRLFRDYTHKTACEMDDRDEQYCSEYFRHVCNDCSHQPLHAPTLQNLCPKCSRIGSYELVKETLDKLLVPPFQQYILTYLSYEYRKELMLVMEDELRRRDEEHDRVGFYHFWGAFNTRFDELKAELYKHVRFHKSLEEHLYLYFPQLMNVSQEEARRAIVVTLNCSRWRMMEQPGHDHFIDRLYESALQEYEGVARPIIDKALRLKLRGD